MKNKIIIALSGVIALAVALNASAYDHDKTYNANSTFLVEEHSTGTYCQNNTYVQVRVNTSVVTLGLEMNITFNPNCVNITAADWTGSAWPGTLVMPPIYEHNNDNIFLSSTNFAGASSGDNLLATITLHCINATDGCTSYLNFGNVVIGESGGNPIYATWQNGTVTNEAGEEIFDIGSSANPYPSIFGTHNGTITVDKTITVNKMYTYPCVGTGGHSEYIEIRNATGWNGNASWDGYKDDWRNISFDEPFTLEANETYNYMIKTGSYPQIIHAKEFNATGGKITCEEFTDANGRVYYNWIPAIKLFL